VAAVAAPPTTVAASTLEAEALATATPAAMRVVASTHATESKRYSAPREPPTSVTMTASPHSWLDYAPFYSPRSSSLLGISKYNAKQDPRQWLRSYALAIENTGGNNDIKCIYFPFCPDQTSLTWLESLDKNSIDEWDQLKGVVHQQLHGHHGTLGYSHGPGPSQARAR
jgi:hypothetical protein